MVPLAEINRALGTEWPEQLWSLIWTGELEPMNHWYRQQGREQLASLAGQTVVWERVEWCPLFRHPRKIWGIGLNYVDHAGDLAEKAPESEPASFMKPDTTIIGHGQPIQIPVQSCRTTGEAELGLIFGRRCRDVAAEDWRSVLAGFTCVIDMTAEDILRKNPRYLTRAKSFDTFFSFGPMMLTPDEVEDVGSLAVATLHNGEVYAENRPSNMMFPPDELVAFHSRVMTFLPGDVLSTGTPRAVPLAHREVVGCRIAGFPTLENPVIDQKAAID